MTRALPRPRGLARLHKEREYEADDRMATAVGFPGSSLFVHPGSEEPLTVDPRTATRVRSTANADVVLAGAMRTTKLLRFRSFYLRSRRTLAVQRREGKGPMAIVGGTRIQAEMVGQLGFVVPRVYDAGFLRSQKADWIVEEVLDGTHVPGVDAQDAAREIISLLPSLSQRAATEHRSLDDSVRDRALTAFMALVDDPPDAIWPRTVDRRPAAERVRSLLEDPRSLTFGLSHGDPGLGNVLRLEDGRLGLIDWEYAGHRAVAHDVMKVILSAPDPAELAATLPEPPPVKGATPADVMAWRRQVATAIVLFLRGWRYRHMRAVRRYSTASSRRRMHATIHTLEALLAD